MDVTLLDTFNELKNLYRFMVTTAKNRGNLHGNHEETQEIIDVINANLDL